MAEQYQEKASSSGVNKKILDALKTQALKEMAFARTYKQGKIKNWQKNEEMYYGKKVTSSESRANVELGRMQEFVHTLLSKIDNPLVFKYTKRKEAQLQRVNRLNAVRQIDQQVDSWDIKDIAGKKQCIIYGRAIFAYYADSIDNEYKAHLDNVDVYDFLIDPSAGGLDVEKARYLGRYGIVKDKSDLTAGAKSGVYIKQSVNNIINGANSTEVNQEETNKLPRTYDQLTIGKKETYDASKFKFWEWFTTYEGVRYYLLITNSGEVIRAEKLIDMFSPSKYFPLGAWPFWTYAAFPDLTEFWTPSYADYVREVFMAQNVSINQMLDNAEAINKPMKVVNVSAIEDLASLKYRKDGIIKTTGDYDANKAVQILNTPSINTPIQVYNLLDAIQEKASGVTAGAKGVSDETGKVGIYEGNQAAAADRFGLLNKSYSFGYTRFARLYEVGIRDHLKKKVAIELIGPNGVETEEVNKRDIYKRGDDFGVLVESSDAETALSIAEKRNKVSFLAANTQNPVQNPRKAYEISASIVGFKEDETRQLMDTNEFGSQELMAEAERDIECILEGEVIKPNLAANAAYKQRFVDFLKDHQEDMSLEQFTAMATYVRGLDAIIISNEARALQDKIIREREIQNAISIQGFATGPKSQLGKGAGQPEATNGGSSAELSNIPLQ